MAEVAVATVFSVDRIVCIGDTADRMLGRDERSSPNAGWLFR